MRLRRKPRLENQHDASRRIIQLPLSDARGIVQAMNFYQGHGEPRFPRAYLAPDTGSGYGICWCPFGCQMVCGDKRPDPTTTIETEPGTNNSIAAWMVPGPTQPAKRHRHTPKPS